MEIIKYKNGPDEGAIIVNGEDQFIAVTASSSKKFKSKKGAHRYLDSFGYVPVYNELSGIENKPIYFVKLNENGDIHWLKLNKEKYTNGPTIFRIWFYDHDGYKYSLEFKSVNEAIETLGRLGYEYKEFVGHLDAEYMDKHEWLPPLMKELDKQLSKKIFSARKEQENLEQRKQQVDFLIKDFYGNRNVIEFNHPVYLKENRYVKRLDDKRYVYEVSDSVLEKLKSKYSFGFDFRH